MPRDQRARLPFVRAGEGGRETQRFEYDPFLGGTVVRDRPVIAERIGWTHSMRSNRHDGFVSAIFAAASASAAVLVWNGRVLPNGIPRPITGTCRRVAPNFCSSRSGVLEEPSEEPADLGGLVECSAQVLDIVLDQDQRVAGPSARPW